MITRRRLAQISAAGLAAPFVLQSRAGAADFTLRWGHAMPASHPLTTRGLEAADKIKKDTNGQIDIQLFPDNQLGGDNDMTAQVRAGSIELYTAAATSIGPLVPLVGVANVAFAFKDNAAAFTAFDGDVGRAMITAFNKVDLHVFDKMWDSGFRQITTAPKPIRSPADLNGFKIRVPTSPMLLSLFRALGASPTSMNVSELYSALQTKIVDGQENPLPIIATRNFHEVQKYCALTNHVWDCFFQVANMSAWKKIPADMQQIVAKHLNEAGLRQRGDIEELNKTLQKQLENKGMVFNTPDPNEFRDALRKAGYYAQWQKTYGEAVWSALEKYVGKLA